MIRKALLICCALLFSAGVAAKDWKSVRIGVEGAYPPFSETTPEGAVVGFDIDIANALCAAMEAKCTLVQQDWDGIIPALLARKYDAVVASMSITEERKKQVAFTDKYYASPARFVHKKGSGISIDEAGLQGKQVGVQRATIMDRFMTDRFGDLLQVKRYTSQDEANLDLVAGRLDLGFMEFSTAEAFLKSEQGKEFEAVGPTYSDPKWFGEGIGIATRKRDKELVAKLNQAIRAIRANGVYDQIRARYFSYDIYGD